MSNIAVSPLLAQSHYVWRSFHDAFGMLSREAVEIIVLQHVAKMTEAVAKETLSGPLKRTVARAELQSTSDVCTLFSFVPKPAILQRLHILEVRHQ